MKLSIYHLKGGQKKHIITVNQNLLYRKNGWVGRPKIVKALESL
jgi:hypothetical protein